MTDVLVDAANSLEPKQKKAEKVVKCVYLEREIWDTFQSLADERGIGVTALVAEVLRRVVANSEIS